MRDGGGRIASIESPVEPAGFDARRERTGHGRSGVDRKSGADALRGERVSIDVFGGVAGQDTSLIPAVWKQ